jgi:hypothetical protein
MYFRQPNYWLALSGGLSYLFNAYVASKYGSTSAVMSSLGLAVTSIWFHITRDDTSFWMDQVFVYAYSAIAAKEAWDRGFIEFGMLFIGMLNAALLYYVGQMGSCFTFSPELEVATVYHASIHLGSSILVSSVLAGSNVLVLTDVR